MGIVRGWATGNGYFCLRGCDDGNDDAAIQFSTSAGCAI